MVLDIVIAIIVIFSMVFGFRAGFVYTFLHAIGWLLSFVLAFVWSPRVKEFLLDKTDFYDTIHHLLSTRLSDVIDIEQIASVMPALLQNAILSMGNQAADSTATSLTDLLFIIVSFLLVVLGVKFIFWMITAILSRKHNDGMTGAVDGLMGLIAGFIKGMLLVFVLLAIMVPVAGLINPDWALLLSDWLDASYVAGTLYDNNLIMLVVRDFLA